MKHRWQNATVLLVLVFSLCITNSHAESWSVIPSGTSQQLTSITAPYAKVAYVAGGKGTLLRTDNQGLTWTQQRFAVSFNGTFLGVASLDTTFAICTGEIGQVQYQFPLKRQWNNPTQFITLNALNAIALSPWTVDTSYNNPGDMMSMHVVRFISVGENGHLENLRYVHYLHIQTGYPTVDSTYVLASQVIIPTSMTLHADAFEQVHGYLVGDSGVVVVSTNQGVNWSVRAIPQAARLRGVVTLSTNSAIVAGESGNLWKTSNAGASWTNITPAGLAENLNAISFIDANTGVVVGDNGLIIKTTDGGASWVRQAVNTFQNFNGIACYQGVDGTNWFAVGDSGTIAQTLYGGNSVDFNKNKDEIDFGDVPEKSKAQDSIVFSNADGQGFLSVRATCSDPFIRIVPDRLILDPGNSGALKIQFTPGDTSARRAEIILHHDATWFTDSVLVTGRGVAAVAKVSVDTIEFGIADTIKHATVTITNFGNIALNVLSAVILDTTHFSVTSAILKPIPPGDSGAIDVALRSKLLADALTRLIIKSNSVLGNDTVIVRAEKYSPSDVSEPNGTTPLTLKLECFPNPIFDNMEISITADVGATLGQSGTLQVVDMLGRSVIEVRRGTFGGEASVISFSTGRLKPGSYLLRLCCGGKSVAKNVVVIR